MTLSDFIDKRTDDLSKAGSNIKDYRVFQFDHVPKAPILRQEVEPVVDACLRYLSTKIPNHLFIFGSRGSGKTLIVKRLGELLLKRNSLNWIYVNCREHNSSFKILAQLTGASPRGNTLHELWQRFEEAHQSPAILVLDEVDLLSEKDRRKDLLYLASRSSQNYMVVLLSNNPRFLDTLDLSIRSTLQPQLIHFKNYDALQLREILQNRAQEGLHEFSEELLAKIAALTVRFGNSDARVAIKTLYYAALEPTSNVEEVFHRARQDLVLDVLAHLDERCLLMLCAVAETPELFVKPVYSRYRALSTSEHVDPFSYAYFYTNLSYLQSIGLIVLFSTKVGRAYTNRIQLLFDRELLGAIWKARMAG